MRSLHFVGWACLFTSLSCARWLTPSGDLVAVERRVSISAGYLVPAEANQIHVRDRGTLGRRVTWFKYHLPPEPLADLKEELLEDRNVQQIEGWALPVDWPDFAPLGFEPPTWWMPQGETFRQEIRGEDGVVEDTTGYQWALGADGQVFVWMWSWNGWTFFQEPSAVGER